MNGRRAARNRTPEIIKRIEGATADMSTKINRRNFIKATAAAGATALVAPTVAGAGPAGAQGDAAARAPAHLLRRAGARAALADDARREGRADDAARAGRPQRAGRHPHLLRRLAAERRQLRPEEGGRRRQQPPGVDGHVRPLPDRRVEVAARHPHPLRRGRRARAQQRHRRRRLPAQHRPRVHAQRAARRGGRARHRRGGARHRHQLDVRALRHRPARRALGPHLRGLRRVARAGRYAGRGGGARLPARRPLAPSERARLRQALRRRRRHRHRHGQLRHGRRQEAAARSGRHAIERARPAAHTHAGLPRDRQGRRRLHHAFVQQLERREGVGQQAASDRHPQTANSASKASSSPTTTPSTRSRRTTSRPSPSRSTPAWTW